MDSFDGLVVIDPDGPDLGIEIRQAQVVVVRVLVGLNDLERSAEDAAEDKLRFAVLPGFEQHVFKLCLLAFVQAERVAVNLPALRTGLVFGSCLPYLQILRLCDLGANHLFNTSGEPLAFVSDKTELVGQKHTLLFALRK